ncbi:hypothetical protein BV898_20031, partial [Hypsibius exemplaris]
MTLSWRTDYIIGVLKRQSRESTIGLKAITDLGLGDLIDGEHHWQLELPGASIFKVIRKATIDVRIFGQVWTLEVEITDTKPEERDIYLSYADSYMMLEGRFCQRRLENITYDWIDLMWQNTTKGPMQETTGPVSENLLNYTRTGTGVDHSVEGSPELNHAKESLATPEVGMKEVYGSQKSGVADSVESIERPKQSSPGMRGSAESIEVTSKAISTTM